MRFLNPALLAGLLLIAVPVVVHLINRRRATRVRFPAVEFLLRSNRNLARRLKLKQWLLLALRISLFALIPAAMARPYFLGEGGETAADRLPASVVLIVDDSASMSWSDGDSTLWDLAISEARERVEALRPWDQVALVFAHHEAELAVGDLSEDRAPVLSALGNHVPSFGGSGLPRALVEAREIQATASLPNRRTIVLTDDAAHAWEDLATDPGSLAGLGAVEVISLGPNGARRNLGIESVTAQEAEQGGAGNQAVEATVRSWGWEGPRRVEVTLFQGDESLVTTVVDVPAGGTAVARFVHRFDTEGLVRLRVSLAEEEGILADNERFLPLQLDRAVRVLLVNGDSRSVSYNDELFYLERALGATGAGRRAIASEVVNGEAFAGTPIDGFDVVVLANVAALPAPEVARIEQFAREGGGVLVSAGDNIDPERWNSLYASILPRPVRSVTLLCDRDDPDASLKATRLAATDAAHPIFRVFDLPGGESLQSATVYSYALLEPRADDVRILASFGDGGPALLERPLGQGRILFWTTTLDFDWTDLPIRTTYLPLTHRMMWYLARRGARTSLESEPGRPLVLDVSALDPERVVVERIGGGRTTLELVDGEASFTPQLTGEYRVLATVAGVEQEAMELAFAVHLPARESDPAQAGDDERQRWLSGAAGDGASGTGADVPERRTTLWPMLLFTVLVILYAESMLSLRRRLWQQLRERWARRRGLRRGDDTGALPQAPG